MMSSEELAVSGLILTGLMWCAFWVGRRIGRCEILRQWRETIEEARAGQLEHTDKPESLLPRTPQDYIDEPPVKPPKQEKIPSGTGKGEYPELCRCPKCSWHGRIMPAFHSKQWVVTIGNHSEICGDMWAVRCGCCGFSGPSAKEKVEAARLWNETGAKDESAESAVEK